MNENDFAEKENFSESEINLNFLEKNLPSMNINILPAPSFSREIKKTKPVARSLILNSQTLVSKSISIPTLTPKVFDITLEKNTQNDIFYSVVTLYRLSKKFIHRLKNASSYNDKTLWKKGFPHEIVQDICYEKNERKTKVNRLKTFIKEVKIFFNNLKPKMRNFFLNNENSFSFYDFIYSLHLSSHLILIPLTLGFGKKILDFDEMKYSIGRILIMIFLSYNAFSNFKTSQFEKGIKVVKKSINLKRIITFDFLADFSIMLYYIIESMRLDLKFDFFNDMKIILGVLYICSLFILSKKIDMLKYSLNINDIRSSALISFVKLIVCFLIIFHYFTCFSIYFGQIQMEFGAGWLFSYISQAEVNLFQIYICSSYSNLFGFFHIDQKISTTHLERVYLLVYLFLSLLLVLYNYSDIISILNCLKKNDDISTKILDNINIYLAEKKTGYGSMIEVLNHLKYNNNNTKKEQNMLQTTKIKEILKLLPPQIKLSLFQSMHGKISEKIPIFQIFSSECLASLICIMEEDIFAPNEKIFEENISNDPSLYLIEKGQIDICIAQTKIVIRSYKTGDYFGDFSLFSNNPFNYSIISPTATIVKSIKKSSFCNLIKDYPNDYEKYCLIRDDLNNNGYYSRLFKRCEVCEYSNHNTLDCIKSSFFSNKIKVIQKFDRIHLTIPQKRILFKRKPEKTLNSLKTKKHLLSFTNNNTANNKEILQEEINTDNLTKHDTSNIKRPYEEVIHSIISFNDDQSETSLGRNLDIRGKTQNICKKIDSNSDTKKTSLFLNENLDIIRENEEYETSYFTSSLASKSSESIETRNIFLNQELYIEKNYLQMDVMHEFLFYFKNNNASYVFSRKMELPKKQIKLKSQKEKKIKIKKKNNNITKKMLSSKL